MLRTSITAAKLLGSLGILTGLVYPLLITLAGQTMFAEHANGSLVYRDNKVVGSELIGQKVSDGRYFFSRPSAADYATLPSGASNLSMTSKALLEAQSKRREELGADAPADLIGASASGLDPHISLQSALFQLPRVCQARAWDETQCDVARTLIANVTEKPWLGLIGQERLNVLRLNLAMDQMVK